MTAKSFKQNNQNSDLPDPLVITRSEHPVSRKYIDRDALKVLHRLRDAGFVAYLVGGGVRDIYLDKIPKDFDISTSARPGQIRKLFRNSRVIGRRFRLVQVFFGADMIIEVSTFRRRSEYDIDGNETVLPANNSFGNPAEDAFRRDLTINALFYEIENQTVIDYTGGVKDLKDKIVRIVGDPDRRITRDPVRMMRVIRHAARASFGIEPQTWEAICRHRDKLSLCPVSRVRDEFFKDLRGGASREWAMLAIDSGLIFSILPVYQEILSDPELSGKIRDQLFVNLGVVDRLLDNEQVVPDSILLAMLLLPWSMNKFELLAAQTQKESFVLSKDIRDGLNKCLSYLNIKRSAQDSIARCIATLPLLIKHGKAQDWPKWLKKKSYFESGFQLFEMYREACGGKTVTMSQPAPLPRAKPDKAQPRKRSPRGGIRGPAFAPNTKGGVFGFRKE